jgi:uncharacterized membrane protein
MNEEEPLGLPKGSVRALIALALVITLCVVAGVTGNIPKELLGMVGIVIGYYFTMRMVAK